MSPPPADSSSECPSEGEGEILPGRLPEAITRPPVDGRPLVIGLGEQTHGSATAFGWKRRVILDLARRGLLGAVAFETGCSVGLQVDAVLNAAAAGQPAGTAADDPLLRAWGLGSRLWHTREITGMLDGLREHARGAGPAGRVRFLGVDVQDAALAARMLDADGENPLLCRVAGKESLSATEARALIDRCDTVAREARPTDGKGNEHGLLALQIARWADAYLLEPDLGGLHRRDRHMAELLCAQLPARGITVLWAHNEHVARNPDHGGGPSLGEMLSREDGVEYRPIGFLCGPGTARARKGPHGREYLSLPLPSAPPGTTERRIGGDRARLVETRNSADPGPRQFLGWYLAGDAAGGDEWGAAVGADAWLARRPASDFDMIAWSPTTVADETDLRVARALR